MPKALSILFGALFTITTAWALGRIFLKRVPAALAREEEHLFAFLSGSALLSLAVFALAAAQALYDAVFLLCGLAILAFAYKDGAFRPRSSDTLPPLSLLWRWTFWPVYAVFATLCFLVAMSPEMSPDGSSYHLGIIARYYRQHGMERITTNLYASLSQGLEMLFLNAWAFGRHSAAALIHCSFLLALPLLLLRFGQRFSVPAAGAAAGLFVLCSPVVIADGTAAYNDVAVACVFFAIFYLLELDAPPLLLGLLAGFAFAIKYTAFLGLAYILLRYALQRRWRDMALCCLPAAALILPWLARNWILYSNPFSPLLNRFWPNPYVHLSFEQDYVELMRRYPGVEDYRQLPLELTVSGRLLGGFLGPLFLLAPLALLSLRKPLGRRVVFVALLFASTYATNIGTRFLIPALPFVSLAMGLAAPAPVLPLLILAHAWAGYPDHPRSYIKEEPGWRVAGVEPRHALRLQTEESILQQRFPESQRARLIEMATPPHAVVFTFSPVPESYTTRQVLASFQSARNERYTDHLRIALYPDLRPAAQTEFRFARQSLTAVRVVQTADLPPSNPMSRDLWSIAEFRVLDGQRELRRAASWRLTAHPNPWEVQMAFDNWPLTRWRSWARIRPGMFVQIDFGAPESVDALRLEHAFDQNGVRMIAQGRAASGPWKTLSHQPVITGATPPLALRRAATAEMKHDGVSHILTLQDDPLWQEFQTNTAAWGVHEVGAVDGIRLYRIE